jgi:glycosyltransferase involved in cell wall biosynthesis
VPETPTASIIILAYNYARFLPAAVESALAQTFADREIIIVDNGSTDETPKVVKPYLDRVIYHRLPANIGRGGGKNAGLAAARGRYIQFLDADDTILPEKLAKSIAVFDEQPQADIVYCDSLFVNEAGQPMEEATRWYRERDFASSHDILGRFLRENFLLTHDGIIRREAIDEIGGFDQSRDHLEDWDFWLRLAVAGKRFVHLPERLAIYNWHMASITKGSENAYRLRRETVYKYVGDAAFERAVGGANYRAFLSHQHAVLAAQLYQLGRWRESRAEMALARKNGGTPQRGLYFKSLVHTLVEGERRAA